MLEGLATWVLNTYLGQYLENLNTDQLSIGLLKGEVELENVPLRKDALQHLDMSVEVCAGFVGKVKLQIPVTRLRSEPWIIAFQQLYLVAGPVNLNEYDAEAEENANFGRKMTQLENIEAIWRSQQESVTSDSMYSSSYSSWLSYGTSFITNIIENIQLKVEDVHIRYEDNQSKVEEMFAFGCTIESLTVQSSDHHWVPKFIYAGDKSMSYKLLELKNFGVYLDSCTEFFKDKSVGELATLMSPRDSYNHNYILEPVSASACLKRNLSPNPLRSRSAPRFTCDLKLETFHINLSDTQYNQIISSLRFHGRLEVARQFRKWRPKCRGVRYNAKQWWQYAIQCHLTAIQERDRGRNWEFAYQRAKDISWYVSIYSDYLKNPIKVSVEMQEHKDKVEQELSFEQLRVLREICMERVAKEFLLKEKASDSANVDPKNKITHIAESGGILQAWFPSWGGWYSTGESDISVPGDEIEDLARDEQKERVLQLEEEIMYVISDSIENSTFMRRDAVFAQLSFFLKKGNITLSTVTGAVQETQDSLRKVSKENSASPLFELEFSNVKLAFESRPRNQCFSFDIELGTMSLKDQVNAGSPFPLLISQQRETLTQFKGSKVLGPSFTSSAVYARLSSMISSVSKLTSGPSVPLQGLGGPLFLLSYEKKPSRTSKTDHRLVITSQALDIVYNNRSLAAISEFFLPASLRQDQDGLMQAWTQSAKQSYENLKENTKEELKKNWESVIQGIMTIERKRWEIELDISAPQIIIPEHYQDLNASVLILDFGKLVFCSSQQKAEGKEADKLSSSDDEDNFATPCSTPDEFSQSDEPTKNFTTEEQHVTESNFHQHIYDKFDLKLCDIQVLVAKAKDNWRFAYQKGTGPMHVIDRFSINLHLEHRALEILPEASTADSQWPNLMLSGSLPQLVIHINEQKVHAIRTICATHWSTDQQTVNPTKSNMLSTDSAEELLQEKDFGVLKEFLPRTETLTSLKKAEVFSEGVQEFGVESKLIVMQFNVDKLSLELQSRGRSVAELQVTGVRTQVSRRPSDVTASLSVHSLLLVDALQTFGSDFELLVASHKHISMDSVSGSLLDSEPCSPTSPGSPDATSLGKSTSPLALSQALCSLASNSAQSPIGPSLDRKGVRSPSGLVSPTFGHSLASIDGGRDSEALINIEVTYIASLNGEQSQQESTGSYVYSSVQFNALDVIANQETVVELVGFIHQLFCPISKPPLRADPKPTSPVATSSKPTFYGSLAGLYSPPKTSAHTPSSLRAEVSFDFQKLTILLLRGVIKDKDVVGRKVGTAVLSHAKIEAALVNDTLRCEGSLGGFQIRDVTPDGNKHQCIVSVGYDPIVERSQDFLSRLHSGIYESCKAHRDDFIQRAFSFKVRRPLVLLSSYEEGFREPSTLEEGLDEDEDLHHKGKLSIELRLASVCYTHSPQFLLELKSCAKEFKQYMTNVASSIKQAATEVAMGLVSKRIESFSSLAAGARNSSPRHLSSKKLNISKSTDTLVFPQPPPTSALDSTSASPTHGIAPDFLFTAELDVVLETPIVVFPEAPNGPNVLVAHLGQISVKNKKLNNSDVTQSESFFPVRSAAFEIWVKDMSLFALNVDERLKSRDIIFHPISATMMNAEELYSCQDHGTPILHGSSLELIFMQQRDVDLTTQIEAGLGFPSDIYLQHQPVITSDSFSLEGGFITPLRINVSRRQYQLLCEAINNLTLDNSKANDLDSETWKLSQFAGPVLEEEEVGSRTTASSNRSLGAAAEHIPLKGVFTVPSLCVELRGDVCQTEQPLVNLVLKDITVVYDATEPFKSSTQMTLCSLCLEDLQSGESDSKPNFLMISEVGDLRAASSEPSTRRSVPVDIPTGILSSGCGSEQYLSASCPEVWNISHVHTASRSLPMKLEMEKPFFKVPKTLSDVPKRSVKDSCGNPKRSVKDSCGNPKRSVKDSCGNQEMSSVGLSMQRGVPLSTQPPSPTAKKTTKRKPEPASKNEALVNINICSIDARNPEFFSKYDGNGRFIDVELNSLRTVINLESWVMVFDFFRSPSQDEKPQPTSSRQKQNYLDESAASDESNMVLDVNVRSLTLVLNKSEGEMAKAAVKQVWVRSVGSFGELTLNGRLGSLSLIDCTSYGAHYKEKFLTVGTEAMTFQLFKYNSEDPSLLRKCDIRLKLKMSSIMYVHSHRFLQELTQFFQQFLLLREKLSDWRALRAGLKVSEKLHGTRVSIDICAGSPIIFIPMWNQSNNTLAVDLGSLTVSNRFLWSGSPETISKVRREDLFDRLATPPEGHLRSRSGSLRSRSNSGSRLLSKVSRTPSSEEVKGGNKCLLDVLQVVLTNMDLFRSERLTPQDAQKQSEYCWFFNSFCILRRGSSLLQNKCALNLQVERNLDVEISRIVPDISIHGTLSKVHVILDMTSYSLIRGLLEHNLGEPVAEMSLQPVFLKLQQAAKLHLRLFPSCHVWTTLSIHLDLDDVVVEAKLNTDEGYASLSRLAEPCQEQGAPHPTTPFAVTHFVKSKWLYESFSDGSKDVDLVSQEILLRDTRFRNFPANKRANVFSNILTPAQDKSLKNANPLQAEIHYRCTRDVTRFTILLNNMRLMAILDWWRTALDFLHCSSPGPLLSKASVSDHTMVLTMPPHPPFNAAHENPTDELFRGKNPPRLNPMVESTGLMTKHSLISDQYQIPFELKINVTDSELVIVENSSSTDTSAVILKTTAVISYRPQFQERPISCNLNQCELYSCVLGREEETALSIIDPVTVNVEVNDQAARNTAADITNLALQIQHTIEISLHQLNIRLSYHDLKMFQRILESLPRQREQATERRFQTQLSTNNKEEEEKPANLAAQVVKLKVLGFSEDDCLHALQVCNWRLDEAALWLTQNAHPLPKQSTQGLSTFNQVKTINMQRFELKTGSINVTIIDDCGDCDVPLLEVCLSHLALKQDYDWTGSACSTLSVDYFNRALSGWEPVVEPWKCHVEWSKNGHSETSGYRFLASVRSEGIADVTITNTLLDLYELVRDNWTDDYYKREKPEWEDDCKLRTSSEAAGSPLRGQRRRTPFVPFALHNDTGCNLLFYPVTASSRSSETSEAILGEVSEENWQKVSTGASISFTFETGKQRHGSSHTKNSHRLIVKVGDWNPVGPVTVDKVGVFFRLAPFQAGLRSTEMPSVRVVFDISMDGLARKLIRVRSALMLTNLLPHTLELKLENVALRLGDVKSIQISSRKSVPVPLLYVWSRMFAKPSPTESHKVVDKSLSSVGLQKLGPYRHWTFSREAIDWRTSPAKGDFCEERVCYPVNQKTSQYRFYVHIRKDTYPVEATSPLPKSPRNSGRYSETAISGYEWIQPGHRITVVSPLTISNLLPFDLHFEVQTTGDQGRIKTGQYTCHTTVNPEEEIDILFWTDNFRPDSGVCIRPETCPLETSVKLSDSGGRPVHLQVKVFQKYGKALKVKVSAFVWLINKTGIPLVFKQEGTTVEAAGQDMEHEVARCATPLLFSFSDQEASPTVCARVGKKVHANATPHFCKKFPLTQGTWVRRLHVSHKDIRPDLVYEIGVDVRAGRGRFRDTQIVTLSPRFQLENRSTHELLISQKCFASPNSVDPEAQSTWLRAIPKCWLPFHWPRLDKDLLLCVRLCDVPGSHWSGGFLIDKTDSFNINIRSSLGDSHCLRVEVLINEATFFAVFSDSSSLPPPFRIDNFSLVPITYYQTGTREDHLRSVARPRFCVSYALDEVTLPPHLTCLAPGGTSAAYNLNVLGEGARLTYENFIYIAFTGTFRDANRCHEDEYDSSSLGSSDLDCLQLVMDVTEGSRVRLARKEVGRRSQLWRMTSMGLLQHEGSSPPQDPASKKQRTNTNILVLDVAGPAPLPSEYTPLMLRKPDERRRLTQTWRFTVDGRLCCQHANLFVQAKDGFLGLNSGNDVVLGPPQRVHYGTMANGIPVEQAVGRQRLRPGSGVLTIKVVMDGPTRVLQITDVQNKSSTQVARMDSGDLICIKENGTAVSSALSSHSKEKTKESSFDDVQIKVVLAGGLGVSIVSSPEELLYALFSDIVFEYMSSPAYRSFDCSVKDIQIDNQLPKAQCGVVLFVSPQSKNDESRHLPALNISFHQLKTASLNAFIFKHLIVNIKNLTLTMEEELLCKCLVLLRHDRQQATLEKAEESEYETQRMLAAATSANATRFYFTHLKLVLNQVRLSVLTSKILTPELRNTRRKLGLRLVQFENALVSLDPFVRCHPFETSTFLLDSIRAHYESELRSQAMRILGSTDFLGNPFGLLADVSEGVQELMREGSVGGLVMNVTHGMANSTAKVTGSLSNAVGRVTMDAKHEETRQRLLSRHLGPSSDHLVAGLMGFGFGLYGGITSIVAQTYTGATKDGLPGFFSGFAKGMVGTVTKPAIGFLDLAAGTASAVRETSKNPSHKLPSKARRPRLVVGMNGLMPRFSDCDARGQELMRLFDDYSSQIFLAYEVLKEGEDDLRLLISSEKVLVFSWTDPSEAPLVVLRINFRDLFICRPITLGWDVGAEESRFYIELTMKAEVSEASGFSVPSKAFPSQLATKRPKVRCDSFAIACKVSEEINFAKTVYEELRHTLHSVDEEDLEDDNHDFY